MGPLAGVRVVEIAGIGPGPFAGMMLSDMGADVVRVDRVGGVHGGDPAQPPRDIMNRGRRSIGVDLKNPDGVETVLVPRGEGRCAHRGVPARCHRAARHRPRRLPGPQPPPRLRAHDRLGPGRADGRDGRSRHELHRHRRGSRCHRPGRRAAAAAAEPGGRLRRWRHAARLRHRLRRSSRPGRSGEGQVVDAAMVDGTAVLTTFMHGMMAMGGVADERGEQPARHRRPLLRGLRVRRREVPVGRRHRAAVLRRAARGTGLTDDPEFANQNDKAQWPRLKERAGRGDPHQDPRRVGRDLRRHRRLRRPDPLARRGAEPRRTPRPARPSSRRDGVVQPAPAPRFSRTVQATSSGRRRTPASTPTRSSPSGAWPTPTAPRHCGRAAPSPDPGPGRTGRARR